MTTIRTDNKGTAYLAVAGVCPRGCGETLFLGEGGYVTCSWISCPEPDAASTMLARAARHYRMLDKLEVVLADVETQLKRLLP